MRLIFRLFFTIAALLCAGFAHAAPTITSTTINGANSELTVTFSEAVFTTTDGSSPLVPGDFTLSMAGGVATIASFDSVVRTSDTEWVLNFTTAGIADGSEVIKAVPASSSSIYDGANNPAAVVQSNNTASLNEKVLPIIAGTAINAANTELTVTFSEAVFTTTDGSSPLVPGDFTLSITGGVATIASFDSVAKTSDTEWVLAFTTAGIANGSERIAVVPASSSSIYDGADNAAAATQSNNNVLLNEKVVPTLSSVSITSNNATPTFAVHNNVVTLTFTASETLSAAVVTFSSGGTPINSGRVTPSNSGNAWTFSYSALNTDPDGQITFSVAFTDAAGNLGTPETNVDDSSSVLFDKSPPTLGPVTIASDNSTSTSWAKTGDEVTLSYASNETLETPPTVVFLSGGQPVVNRLGHSPAITYANTGNSYTAQYTAAGGDTEGVLSYIITFANQHGISGIPVTGPTNSSSVTFDKTAPTLSNLTLNANNTHSTHVSLQDSPLVTLRFRSSDPLTGLPTVTFTTAGSNATAATPTVTHNGNNWYTATYVPHISDTQGVITYNITNFTNQVGISGTTVSRNDGNVTYETVVPTLSNVDIETNNVADDTVGINGNIVTLVFTQSEDLIVRPVVVFKSGGVAITDQTIKKEKAGNVYTYSYTIMAGDAGGPVTYTIDFKDYAENPGVTITNGCGACSGSAVVDRTLPTLNSVAISSNNAANSATHAKAGNAVTLSFNQSETLAAAPTVTFTSGGIDINASRIATSSGGAPGWTSTYTTANTDLDGPISYRITFSDTAGNAGIAVTGSGAVVFDDEAPTISNVSIASNNSVPTLAKAGNVVTLSYTGNETLVHPQAVTFTSGGGAIASNRVTYTDDGARNYTAKYTTANGDTEGAVSYTIVFKDLADNNGTNITSGSGSVTFDKSAPTLVGSTSTPADNATGVSRNANIVLNFNELITAGTGNITVNLTGTSTETFAVGGSKVSISGATMTLNPASDFNASASYDVQVPNTAVADMAGNAYAGISNATTRNFTTGTGSGPTINTVTLLSGNNLAKAGEVVTLTFTASVQINTPVVVFRSGGAAVENRLGNGSGITYTHLGSNEWTAAYTAHASDTDGTISYNLTTTAFGTSNSSTFTGNGVTFDASAPTLSSVGVASNNSTSNSSAKNGDEVTLSFTASETIAAPTVVFLSNGQPVADRLNIIYASSGNDHTAKYTAAGSDTDGVVSYTITFTDSAGNAGTDVTGPTNASSVTHDGTAPTLSNYIFTSDNATNTRANAGDRVTLVFTANEPIVSDGTSGTLAVAFKTAGSNAVTNATSITNPNGNTFHASYIVAGGDVDGAITYIINFTNEAGIAGTQVSQVGGVTSDNTAPTASAAIASNNADASCCAAFAEPGDLVIVTISANENIAQPVVSFESGGHAITNALSVTYGGSGTSWTAQYTAHANDTEGAVTYSISFDDEAGNSGTSVTSGSGSVTFDKIAPTIAAGANSVRLVSTNNPTTLANDHDVPVDDFVILTFTANEILEQPTVVFKSGGSVVHNRGNIIYAFSNNKTTWTAKYAPHSSDSEGNVTFTLDFNDRAGNDATQVTSTTDSSAVEVDLDHPELTATPSIISNNSTNTLAKAGDTITLTFVTDEETHTPTVIFRSNGVNVVDSNTPTSASGNKKNWTTSYTTNPNDTDGDVSYSLIFNDLATNYGPTIANGGTIRYDNTPPTVTAVAIASNNAGFTDHADVGDVVTLLFTTSETIKTNPTVVFKPNGVAIASNRVTYTDLGSNNWRARYTTTNGDQAGVIAFSIQVDDLAGNSGSTVTGGHASNVTFDKTVPTVGSVSITSNNTWLTNCCTPGPTTHAKVGHEVTLSFTADNAEVLRTPTVVFMSGGNPVENRAGNGSQVIYATSDSGVTWTAKYTTHANDTEGPITYAIDFVDRAGNNNGTDITSGSGSVTFDRTAPTLNSISITSDNVPSTHANTDDIVTLTIVGSEKLQQPVIVFNSGGAALTGTPTITYATANNGITWTAKYVPHASDTNGDVTSTINYKDLAGNDGNQRISETDSSAVEVDLVVPTVSVTSIASNNITNGAQSPTLAKAADVITLTFVTNEKIHEPVVVFETNSQPVVNRAGNGSGITYTNASGDKKNWTAAYTTHASDHDGDVSYTINFEDLATNNGVEEAASGTIRFDDISPNLTGVTLSSGNSADQSFWFAASNKWAKPGDTVFVDFTGNTALINSTVAVQFFSGGTAVTNAVTVVPNSGNAYTAAYVAHANDIDGPVTFKINYKDLAGNAGTEDSSVDDATNVTFDKTAPNITAVGIASNNAAPGPTTHAKVGHVVTLTFTTNEAIQTPTVVFTSNGAAVAGGVTYNNPANKRSWTAQYTTQNGDTEGTVGYTIDFTNLAGIDGTDVTSGHATNVTLDKTAPTVGTVSIVSSQSPPTLAKVGDMITLTFVTNEKIQTPTVTFMSNGVTTAGTNTPTSTGGDKKNWTTSYITQPGDTHGNVTFSIAFKDLASNAGITETTVDDASTVFFDKTFPWLTNVAIASNNSTSNSWATSGDIVTLNFKANEQILAPTVTFNAGGTAVNGANTPTNPSGDKMNWTTSYTGHTSDAGGTTGPVTFSVAFNDLSGNSGTADTTVDDASSVTFDLTPPILTSVGIASDNATSTLVSPGGVVTLAFTANEPISGSLLQVTFQSGSANINDASITYNNTTGNTWTASYTADTDDTSGPVTFTIAFTSLSGITGTNVTSVSDSSTVTFENSTPTLTSTSMASNNATNTLAIVNDVVSLTFTANEAIATPEVTFKSGGDDVDDVSITYVNANGNKKDWTASYTAHGNDTDGSVTFTINFSDIAGNTGIPVTSGSGSVAFDNTSPTPNNVSISSNNAISTSWATSTDIITVLINPNETISQPTVTFKSGSDTINASRVTYANLSGNTWTAKYTGVLSDAEGLVTFTIASFTNLHGITKTAPITAVTDNSSVTYDKTAPVLQSVTIASSNTPNTVANGGDVVKFTFTTNEPISEPVLTAWSGGQAIADATIDYVNTTANTWTASYTAAPNDGEGLVTFNISVINNLCGIVAPGVTSVTDTSSVTIDTTAPTITVLDINSDNPKSNVVIENNVVTLSFTTSEEIHEPTVTFVSGGTPIPSSANTFVTDEEIKSSPAVRSNSGPTLIASSRVSYLNPTGDKKTWTASYTALTTDGVGLITYTIVFTDLSGILGTIGGSTVPTGTVTVNSPPISNAGINQAVLKETVVTLDGSTSSDINAGDTLTYAWAQTSGPTVILSSATAMKPTFTSPTMIRGDVPLPLVFSLIVTDDQGRASSAATVTIVIFFTFNFDPIANAGPDRALPSGSIITLDGSSSLDPDADDTITFAWTQISGRSVTLSSTTVVKPTFTAPTLIPYEEPFDLIFSLIVTDNHGRPSLADTVTITVRQLLPSEAFAMVRTEVEAAMQSNADNQLANFSAGTGSVMQSVRTEFIDKQTFCKFKTGCGGANSRNQDTNLNFLANHKIANINGSTRKINAARDGKATISTGNFLYTKHKDGAETFNASRHIRWEYPVSELVTLGRFLGGSVSQTSSGKANEINISALGLNAGGYFIGNVAQDLILDGYIAGSVTRNEISVENTIMKASSIYPGQILATGIALTGSMDIKTIKLRPSLSMDLKKSFAQTAKFGVEVGYNSSVEQASFGLSEQLSIAFTPEFVVPYNMDKTSWDEAAVITAAPKLRCQKTTTSSCGGGMAVGVRVVSADWKDRFTTTASIDIIGSQISNTFKMMYTKTF